MNDLVKRDPIVNALKADINIAYKSWDIEKAKIYECTLAFVQSLDSVEAEPRHGRWIWNKRLGEWYCSNCDRIMKPYTVEKSDGEYEMAQPFYCGWCGAKMDERKQKDGTNR